jgi:glyoxylase I family protein
MRGGAVSLDAVHHIALTVSDLAKSTEWYQQVLGFSVIADFEEDGGQRRKVVMTSGRFATRIGLVEHRGTSPGRFDERVTGLDHLSFSASPGDLDRLAASLGQHNVPHSPPHPAQLNPAARVVVFRDPDNIQLEFYAQRTQPEP